MSASGMFQGDVLDFDALMKRLASLRERANS
jgi:hypothetical protein